MPAVRASRSTTAQSSRKAKSVRVWAEAGVTLAVTDDPPQFIRLTVGHERIAPDDKQDTIERYETMVYEACEATLEKQIKKLKKVIRRASS